MTNVQVLQKPADAVEPRPETSEEPGQILSLILLYLHRDDVEGARKTLRDWCNRSAWRKAGADEIVSIAVLLIDKVADLMAEKIHAQTPASSRDFCPRQDEYSFTNSSHLSLLTASVIRQRSQIAALLALVDKLSRRFA